MKKGEVKRGFKAFRNTYKDDARALKRLRNCDTCKFQYQDEDTREEVCHNNNVTKFDMVQEENKTYCTYWTPVWAKEER
jgi:hypothetical protein